MLHKVAIEFIDFLHLYANRRIELEYTICLSRQNASAMKEPSKTVLRRFPRKSNRNAPALPGRE